MIRASACLINGQESDQLPVTDRGLQYGDGCFETIAAINGMPLLWERHMARLQTGCRKIGMSSAFDPQQLLAECERLSQDSDRHVIKIIITRGQGGRGFRQPIKILPTRIVCSYPWPSHDVNYTEEGIRMKICRTPVSQNTALAGIKHLNRLEQVLARSEWDDEFEEGLMFDSKDRLVEGTMSNVFLQIQDSLLTPALTEAGIRGVMREELLSRLPGLGIGCKETEIKRDMIYKADAMFITNSIIGVWPVVALGTQRYPVTALERRIQQSLCDDGVVG